jgi:hypothetical protein
MIIHATVEILKRLFNIYEKLYYMDVLLQEIYNVTTYEFDPKEAIKPELYGDEEHLKHVINVRRSNIYKPYQRKKIMVRYNFFTFYYDIPTEVRRSLAIYLLTSYYSSN